MIYSMILALIFVVLAGVSPLPAQQMFFENEQACLEAQPGTFSYYQPHGTTRLEYWNNRVAAKTAALVLLRSDLCANERTVDPTLPKGEREAFRIVRLQAGTWVFQVKDIPVADGRCGNDFLWARYVPEKEEPSPLPAKAVEVLPPAPTVIRPEPPPRPLVPEARHECPACLSVEVTKMDQKGKVLKFSAKLSDERFVGGEWSISSGRVIGLGKELLVSYDRLNRLFKKKPGVHVVKFVGLDQDGHQVACAGEVEIRRHGRFWLFKVPGINCLYAWTADIKNWSGAGTVEKGLCAAGAAIPIWLGPEGVVAGFKHGVPVLGNLL